ncbi:MAG: preprotein translocase subunit SecE [Alphaproteobacteria bacterium]|nr:MAG: preprotein translocase subunit SecE [Alphaproteobacteria bacterium]
MIKNVVQFSQEVRREIGKVTWPTRRETWTTTLLVFIMTVLAALFFLFVDQVLAWVVKHVLSLGS